MEETIPLPLEERLRGEDPTDYIQSEYFKKVAKSLDPNPNNPWEKSFNGPRRALFQGKKGTVIISTVNQSGTTEPDGLIVAAKDDQSGIQNSTVLRLECAKVNVIADSIKAAANTIDAQTALQFARLMTRGQQAFAPATPFTVANICADNLLEMLPSSYPQTTASLDFSGFKDPPTHQQVQGLQEFLKIASSRLSPVELQTIQEKLLSYHDLNDFSNQLHYIQIEVLRSALSHISTHQHYLPDEIFRETNPKNHFPVEQLAKRKIASIEQMREVLGSMPAELTPEKAGLSAQTEQPSWVDVSQIVGGGYAKRGDEKANFLSNNRSEARLFSLIQGLASGSIDVDSDMEPIALADYEGKLYVEGGGHNRIAALKALDVPLVPALVTVYR